ncbi:unnamed protein product [Blepharisma stoltei]|uniref:non-specific serine/threonine protein kinase n=1 Tax=Blepharisma stoltei TaxID=1481888 RepID=A0AAU9IW58_9CILI|nr:unnamed protein product [Blepharisma stoltei]
MSNKPNPLRKSNKEPISQNTLERAQAAKEYIERKFLRLKKMQEEKQEEWTTLRERMNEMNLSNTDKQLITQEIQHKEAELLRKKRQKISVFDFEPLAIIGKGAFGEVRLVRNTNTGEIAAMKKMSKSDLVFKNQIKHIRAERDVMALANNPWVVQLKYSFQDEKYLYLVMEYLPGGDLMTLLIRKNVFTEEEARFYIAEAILAVDSTHKLNYIHRDLKPDNILIDATGHVKLTDFGLSKHIEINPLTDRETLDIDEVQYKKLMEKRAESRRNRKLAYSTVGTPDYIAPEVFHKEGYCETVDWWSIGVILFEMVVGYPPFFSEEPADTCQKIVSWQKHFTIPAEARLSPALSDFIRRLIAPSETRLGNRGVEEIKRHPFFRGFDWDHIREMTPPMVPNIENEIDTSNFDKHEETEPFYPNLPMRKKKARQDPNFVGFTFKRDVDNQRLGLISVLEELEKIKASRPRPAVTRELNINVSFDYSS